MAAVAPALTHPLIPPPSIARAIFFLSPIDLLPGLERAFHLVKTAATTGCSSVMGAKLPVTLILLSLGPLVDNRIDSKVLKSETD